MNEGEGPLLHESDGLGDRGELEGDVQEGWES